MLTESFLASVAAPEKGVKNTQYKDIGIYQHQFHPIFSVESTYKKSSTLPNCLAITTSHIFAAQAEKAVIHVYNRKNASQEAVVPFREKIHSIAIYGDTTGGGVLVLGTQGGGVILWELCTGRQVSTPQSHLQPTTCLTVDRTSNFLLSGSPDSSIYLWSIPSLLSFLPLSTHDASQAQPLSPLRSLSNHRAAITALEFGHSSGIVNIAISTSQDNTCIVWDYFGGSVLHTFLLVSAPLCLTVDPADRAAYVGYEDGSIQLLKFYKDNSFTHPLHQFDVHLTPSHPAAKDKWLPPSPQPSATLSIQLSYDGATLLSGHRDGAVQSWDVAKGLFVKTLAELSAPVTNLKILSPTGFPITSLPPLKLHKVVKPRYESSAGGYNNSSTASGLPANYTLTAQFATTLSSQPTDFQTSLTSPTFSQSLLDASIAELNSLPSESKGPRSNLALGGEEGGDLGEQNTHLLAQLNAALHTQREAMSQLLEMDKKVWRMQQDLRTKSERKKARRERKRREAERERIIISGSKEEKAAAAASTAVERKKKKNKKKTKEKSSSTDKRRVECEMDVDEEEQAEQAEQEEDEDSLSSDTDEMTESN